MKSQKPESVKEYIAGFPKETQKILRQVRTTMKKVLPKSKEKISYGIPAFSIDDKYVVYFAGFKNHISLFPAPRGHEQFKEILSKYKGGKGTVQFPLDEPIPFSLITKITKFRLKEHKIKMALKKKK